MKKLLLIMNFLFAFLLFIAMNVSAQDVYFAEGFATKSLPDGWSMSNSTIMESGSMANVDTTAIYGVKMKVADPVSSFLQMPAVNGVTFLSFWCKPKNNDNNLVVKIQRSADGINWTDAVTEIPGLDLNLEDFQEITVPLNIEGVVSIRIFVTTSDASSSKGAFYVDDIQLGKPAALANDASLLSLSVDSALIEGFDFNTTNYDLVISHMVDYTVTAEPNNPDATVVITQVADINGTEAERTATVLVTSADQSVTATTTIVFTLGDYWYKEGFDEIKDLEGWERGNVMQDQTPNYGSTDIYPGVGALKFTGGHPGDANEAATQVPGYLLSPKLINVGSLSFWVSAEVVIPEHELNVYIKTSDTDSTLVKSITGADLTYEWQEVVVVIEEAKDSIQIRIEGICDVNNAGDSRIWMDDFLVTYYEAPLIGADDATLSSLMVGGTVIDGFDPAVTSYSMVLSLIMDPTVTAEVTDPNATVVITQATNTNGTQAERTATIVVTSADQSVTSTTTIEFNPTTGISDFNSSEVSFYPNPVNSLLNFKMPENSFEGIEIFNMQGQKVMQETIKAGQKSINVEGLSKGVYVISLSGEAGTHTAKFIK